MSGPGKGQERIAKAWDGWPIKTGIDVTYC